MPCFVCCRPLPGPEDSCWGQDRSRPRYQSFVCCGLRQAGALQCFAEPSPSRKRVIWLRDEAVLEHSSPLVLLLPPSLRRWKSFGAGDKQSGETGRPLYPFTTLPLYHDLCVDQETSKCLRTNAFGLGPTLALKQGLREWEDLLARPENPGHVISAPELLRLLGRPPPRSRAPSKLSPRWVQP